ncbi:hypothetical protein SAY87_029801 [Trapa incisa]|uniref:Uncharacterized protein n=1 Tax=Trapa incisa TaxID=236973 RepID=A0AAN7KDL5_9MYRT|nr:hypothetical protein SAY87_029801 [Trapa incisa]
MKVEGKPNDTPKDLLKESLHLQESLMVLEKLKLASSADDERRFERHQEKPTTSSSQFSSVDFERGSNAALAKAGKRNLIAKLMGLKVISKSVRKLQEKKILQQQKYELNAKVSQLKKLEHEVVDDEPYQQLGKHFKGLLNNSIRKVQVVNADHVPPIVLMRPSNSHGKSNEAVLKDLKMNGKFLCRNVNGEVVNVAEGLREAPQYKEILCIFSGLPTSAKIRRSVSIVFHSHPLASETLHMDCLDPQLKRDLYFHRGAAKSKLWEASWTKGFCLEDAETVKEGEESIFSSLVEEAVVELVQLDFAVYANI